MTAKQTQWQWLNQNGPDWYRKRQLRSDLTPEQRERADRIGSLEYKSHRKMDMRVKHFIPSREQH